MREEIKKLIAQEKQRANEIHGDFNSPHEGYAVLLEEYEEAADELRKLECHIADLWRSVKHDEIISLSNFSYLERIANNFILEAIQVAAMVEKYKDNFTEV